MRPHPDPSRPGEVTRLAESGQTPPLGAILAGGASRRYGAPKALARIGGVRLVERVRDALLTIAPDPVLVTRDPERYAWLGLPSRPDAIPGGGPLGGLHTALLWARELGRPAALIVACDMPFLAPELLREIVRRASEGRGPAVAPEGPGRFGVEPLCACYSTAILPEVETRLRSGDLSLGRLLLALDAERLPLREVRGFGSPEVLFHNVNTREDRLDAERIAHAPGRSDATP